MTVALSTIVLVAIAVTFAVAGLTEAVMSFHSSPFVVVMAQQNTGNDPMNCFRSNVTINTCPLKSNITGIIHNDPMDCFKPAGHKKMEPADNLNYTKSVQSFLSLIPTAGKITAINKNIVGGSGPVKDMSGIWNVMNNANMTRYDRQLVLDDINHLLAAAKPGFTKIQQDALSLCITTEVNSLGPMPNY